MPPTGQRAATSMRRLIAIAALFVLHAGVADAAPRAVREQATTGMTDLAAQPMWNPCCSHKPYDIRFELGRCERAPKAGQWHCLVVVTIRKPRDLATYCHVVERVSSDGYRFRSRGRCHNGTAVFLDSVQGGAPV